MVVRYRCVICQQNKLGLELLANQELSRVYTAVNINYNRNIGKKL